jgi:hypothetical protein
MGVTNKRTITKTRRKTRDVDQVKADILSPKHLKQFKETKAIEDLPGLGRHYCVECAKWFDTDATLVLHQKGKPHKRRYVVPLFTKGIYLPVLYLINTSTGSSRSPRDPTPRKRPKPLSVCEQTMATGSAHLPTETTTWLWTPKSHLIPDNVLHNR